MLAAGDPSIPVQYIDVRDMAEWAIRMAEGSKVGVYNTVGPARPLNVGELIETARNSVPAPPKVTWVPAPVTGRKRMAAGGSQ